MHCSDLQRMADRNIASALILFDASNWSNSYYLAGYSIEMALKSLISRKFFADDIPNKNFVRDTYTHEFKVLIGLAGLKHEFDIAVKKESKLGSNWSICTEWTPECRYQEKNETEARELLNAIRHDTDGVLPWIKTYW